MSKPELTECRICGCAVLDASRHRRWHDVVVTSSNRALGAQHRFIGSHVEAEVDDPTE